LGYNEFRPPSFEAGPSRPGCSWSHDDQVVADIKAARSRADLVIPFMHWGQEYRFEPNERQRSLARTMIDAGADAVIGSHPHVVEGVEVYKGGLTAYCLGDFVFDEWVDHPDKPERHEPVRTGWLLKLTLDKAGRVAWETVVTRTGDDGFPRPLPGSVGPS